MADTKISALPSASDLVDAVIPIVQGGANKKAAASLFNAALIGDWLGPWVTATAYALNDVVSNGGSSYICVEAHTSGTFATDLAAVKWEIVAQKGDTGSTGAAGSNGTNGTNGVDGKFSGTEVIKTAAYTALAADVGETIILNKATADTLSFDAAATLGSTWMVMVKNIGAGTWSLDPNGAETIDGAATISLAQNESIVVSCNGTALRSLFRGSAAGGVLPNGQWLEGRNAANSADLEMFRVNSADFTEWSNPLYYDDTGGFSDRQAKFTLQRNTGASAPSTVVASIYSLVESKGDNASLKGASAGYFDSRDRSDVTGANKGVLHGLTVNVGPRVARNNTPYDDAAAVVIGNSGTASGTEGLYIGHNVGGGGNDFLAAIGIDSHSTDAAIYVNGTHNYGLDFSRGAGSTLTTAAIRLPNNKNVVGRNAANSADISLIKLNASNLVSLRDDVVTISSTQMAIQSSASFAIPLTVTSTNADAVAGPLVLLDRNSASPAANDLGGAFYFYFRNLSAASVLGGGVSSTLLDPTAGSEDVRLTFDTVVAGTFATRLGVGAGVYIGSPTNGDMGVGTLNLDNALYKDGLQVVNDRRTGWAAATGTATRTTFATGSVTLPLLAERVKALIDDLISHGLIGA